MSGGVVSGQFTEALADYLAEWFSNGAELPREELVRDAQGILDALLASGVVREEAAVRAEALREVDHWKAHAEEAGQGFSQVCRDYARVSAGLVRLRERIEGLADEWQRMATVLDHPDEDEATRARGVAMTYCVDRLRAALAPQDPA